MASNNIAARLPGSGSGSGANAVNAAANVTDNAAAEAGDKAATPPSWIADFCDNYGDVLIAAGLAFLAVALLLALASGIIALRGTGETPAARAPKGLPPGVDPIKLVDALKALLEALTKAPVWFAIFLGGGVLLWLAGDLAETVCIPDSGNVAAAPGEGNDSSAGNATSNGANNSATGNAAGNVQSNSAAGNVSGGAQPAQPPTPKAR